MGPAAPQKQVYDMTRLPSQVSGDGSAGIHQLARLVRGRDAITGQRSRRRWRPVVAGSLIVGLMIAVPATSAQAATGSQASEVYVATGGSTPELEVIDSTSGAEIGSPVPLSDTPTAIADYTRKRSAASEVVVAEDDAFQEVDPATETASTAISLALSLIHI